MPISSSQIALIILFCVIIGLSMQGKEARLQYFQGNLTVKRKAISNLLTLLFAIVLIVISVTRPESMADYKSYKDAFSSGYLFERFEPSFFIIKDIAFTLNWDYIGVFVIYATISVGLKTYCILRMSNQIWLSLLVWISTSFILMDMITIRASVASAFMLLAIKYKCDQKLYKCLLSIVIAILFHYSAAIILLTIPFLSITKSHRNFYIWIIPICLSIQIAGVTISKLIPLFEVNFILDLYAGYSDDEAANLLNFLTIGRCLIAIVLWIQFKNWKNVNPYALFSLKVYTIGCALFMLLGDLLRVAFRIAELLWCTDIIAYPLITYLFARRNKLWPILVCAILFYITITKQSYWAPQNL